MPLTDSLARTQGVNMRRTSLQLRNPQNAPDSLEKCFLHLFAKTKSNVPKVVRVGEQVHYFKPIYIQMPGCLKCHGKQIAPPVKRQLSSLYPADQATGYEMYTLRGMWHLSWLQKGNAIEELGR